MEMWQVWIMATAIAIGIGVLSILFMVWMVKLEHNARCIYPVTRKQRMYLYRKLTFY